MNGVFKCDHFLKTLCDFLIENWILRAQNQYFHYYRKWKMKKWYATGKNTTTTQNETKQTFEVTIFYMEFLVMLGAKQIKILVPETGNKINVFPNLQTQNCAQIQDGRLNL
jgi:hypothetical protein